VDRPHLDGFHATYGSQVHRQFFASESAACKGFQIIELSTANGADVDEAICPGLPRDLPCRGAWGRREGRLYDDLGGA
jgi:hypothetical protein